ncbi:hypothetical protein [Bradyrhizobium sp. STM 3809]|uniref:hypothetical protein n=1 Tax=Bradyrhizobium sp. STM 3809 TaxID=551936 RepID=UPI00031E57C3|nr:hypothetical protein [Bradyrhizobium sp. STM 3809]
MRKTEVSSRFVAHTALRALRLSAVALGIGLVVSAGAARAQEDEEDDKTFEEKIIDNLMRGIGGTNMETPSIEYRERSPLVVPPKLDLPPPAAAAQANAPNWPKDPDEQRRRAAAAARKKDNKDPVAAARPLTPAEMKMGRTAAAKQTEPIQPGVTNNPMLSPAQLGFKGGLFGMFKGSDSESKPFTSEPQRETLTQPPPGYQTPSPSYAYGTGKMEPIGGKQMDIMTGKER